MSKREEIELGEELDWEPYYAVCSNCGELHIAAKGCSCREVPEYVEDYYVGDDEDLPW